MGAGGRVTTLPYIIITMRNVCVTVVSVALSGGARTVSIPKFGKTYAGFL